MTCLQKTFVEKNNLCWKKKSLLKKKLYDSINNCKNTIKGPLHPLQIGGPVYQISKWNQVKGESKKSNDPSAYITSSR